MKPLRRSRISLRSIRAAGGIKQTSDAKRAARTIFHVVIAGLDPAIHAAVPFLKTGRRILLSAREHGPPRQARRGRNG
jgi:hypothetical protein